MLCELRLADDFDELEVLLDELDDQGALELDSLEPDRLLCDTDDHEDELPELDDDHEDELKLDKLLDDSLAELSSARSLTSDTRRFVGLRGAAYTSGDAEKTITAASETRLSRCPMSHRYARMSR